jgi:hypothetical protein
MLVERVWYILLCITNTSYYGYNLPRNSKSKKWKNGKMFLLRGEETESFILL